MQIHNTDNQPFLVDKPTNSSLSGSSDFASQLHKLSSMSQKTDTNSSHSVQHEQDNSIKLGSLSGKNTTVAQLLLANPQLKASTWSIIHNPIPDNNRILSKKLDDAVKPFMGTDYKDIDCYTLVVNGLKNMGVRYSGQDSLSKQLIHRAHIEGLANNAYFTGEGITEAMGKKIYTHSISRVSNIEQQSKDIFKEMQGLMKKGDILSFSLQTKGHTGVISQNQKQWTYINSGRLDHSISQNSPRHGIGEETLLSEINNWIKLAHKRNESLQITIGRLDTQKFV